MEPLGLQLIKEHIADMQREAAAHRLVAEATAATAGARGAARHPRVAARWVSNGLMFLATRLDPNLGRPSYGRE